MVKDLMRAVQLRTHNRLTQTRETRPCPIGVDTLDAPNSRRATGFVGSQVRVRKSAVVRHYFDSFTARGPGFASLGAFEVSEMPPPFAVAVV